MTIYGPEMDPMWTGSGPNVIFSTSIVFGIVPHIWGNW